MNAYIGHFLSGSIYQSCSRLFCFTGTNINGSPVKHIDEVLDDLKDIHKNAQHGLVLCFKVSKVNIIEVIEIPSIIKILPIVLETNKESFLMITVYCAPAGSFIDNFILLTNELPIKPRILIMSNFNLDQMLADNVAKIAALIQNFNLLQCSQYSTPINWGFWNIVYFIWFF